MASSGDPAVTAIDTSALRDWLRLLAQEISANHDFLTQLDSAIGDADHGSNMDRGFTAVVASLESELPTTPSALFKTVGMTLVSRVGGASGPLYGTLFLRMAASADAQPELDGPAFAAALRAGLEGVLARGRAELGDKTMYDALAPACDALDAELASGRSFPEALAAAEAAAAAGRDSTTPMLAKKGRASYLGERSIGHQDPGATSTAMLVATAARALG